jgi:hypothetical protein
LAEWAGNCLLRCLDGARAKANINDGRFDATLSSGVGVSSGSNLKKQKKRKVYLKLMLIGSL